ncbi:MAG: hypothetical protein IT289_12720 [Oligoflexia bacterium]|nr:hypothetical protein [Oligoflexia bacterium]
MRIFAMFQKLFISLILISGSAWADSAKLSELSIYNCTLLVPRVSLVGYDTVMVVGITAADAKNAVVRAFDNMSDKKENVVIQQLLKQYGSNIEIVCTDSGVKGLGK